MSFRPSCQNCHSSLYFDASSRVRVIHTPDCPIRLESEAKQQERESLARRKREVDALIDLVHLFDQIEEQLVTV